MEEILTRFIYRKTGKYPSYLSRIIISYVGYAESYLSMINDLCQLISPLTRDELTELHIVHRILYMYRRTYRESQQINMIAELIDIDSSQFLSWVHRWPHDRNITKAYSKLLIGLHELAGLSGNDIGKYRIRVEGEHKTIKLTRVNFSYGDWPLIPPNLLDTLEEELGPYICLLSPNGKQFDLLDEIIINQKGNFRYLGENQGCCVIL